MKNLKRFPFDVNSIRCKGVVRLCIGDRKRKLFFIIKKTIFHNNDKKKKEIVMPITIRRNICANVDKALKLEWLDTNGLGGYASSTILGCHTRKYHGLLVARLEKPSGKYVLLSSLEDSLCSDDREFFLSVHKYPGILNPEGFRYLTRMELDLVPTFTYRLGPTCIKKQIALLDGKNTALIRYDPQKNQQDVSLKVRPLLAFRDFHSLTKENIFLRPRTFPVKMGFLISPYEGMPSLNFQVNCDHEFYPSPVWYRNFEYPMERDRGFEYREDLFSPGVFEVRVEEGHEIIFSASTEEQTFDLADQWADEMDRRKAWKRRIKGSSFKKTLALVSREFVTAYEDGSKGITAGYPWFEDWGRDAMIALPGLLLGLGDNAVYLEILKTYAGRAKDGLIPNFIGETPEKSAYNSADTSLWYAWAVQQYLQYTRKWKTVQGPIWKTLKTIYRKYREGTRFDIHMLENGLISAGGPDVQVSWMDAMVDGKPVTPRWGVAVDINALWYNTVCFIAELAERFDDKIAGETKELKDRVKQAFIDTFWMEEQGYLGDVYREETLVRTMRPNQIFAASLPCSPLSEEQADRLVKAVGKDLLTRFGLRTLSPSHTDYQGRYQGGPGERDFAYHNGTVWPWLLGHYGEALLKCSSDKAAAVESVERILLNFEPHLEEAGLGSVSEIFDGDPPHLPNGCPSQAWSVAELLRLARLLEIAKDQLRPKPVVKKASPKTGKRKKTELTSKAKSDKTIVQTRKENRSKRTEVKKQAAGANKTQKAVMAESQKHKGKIRAKRAPAKKTR
jgi:predicted glycogen debranching enzyme